MPRRLKSVQCELCGMIRQSRANRSPRACRACSASEKAKMANLASVSARRLRPYEWLFRTLLRVAKKAKREVRISYEDFVAFTQQEFCAYCQKQIYWPEFSEKGRGSYHLDRKDNHLEYELGNLVVCCSRCNRVKGAEFTHQEFLVVAASIRQIDATRATEDRHDL